MAERGAPLGNQNATRARQWREAILRAVARKGGTVQQGLDKAADKLVDAVEQGEQWAIKEMGDRVDGKPAQQLVLNGDEEGGAVKMEGVLKLVKPGVT